MKKRLYSSAAGLFVCLACCNTCSHNFEVPDPPLEYMLYNPKRLENDCKEYQVYSSVITNRPLRCYSRSYSSAFVERYVGSLVLLSEESDSFLKGKEYIDIPVGAAIVLEKFFVKDAAWFGIPETEGDENYFLTVFIPSLSEFGDVVVYFMGRNNTLQPLPWNSLIPIPLPGAFRAIDIDELLPGGEWISTWQRTSPRYRSSQSQPAPNEAPAKNIKKGVSKSSPQDQ